MKPFRFGVHIRYEASREGWRSKARKVEDLGYSSFMIADHLWIFPSFVGMITAAEATTTLRVGTHVLGNDFRHPVLMAREAAAVDLMSDGRLELGLGTGYNEGDYFPLGIPLDPAGTRVGRLEEAVQVIKGVWGNTPFSFKGQYYQIDELESVTKPVQKPRPPILIGGGGKRVLSLAAREADIVGINFKTTPDGNVDVPTLTAPATHQKIQWIREAAGTRFDDLELEIMIPFMAVSENREQAAEGVAQRFKKAGVDIDRDQILETPHALVGSANQLVEVLQERREQYGISYYVILEDQFEQFAPVVARLSGI